MEISGKIGFVNSFSDVYLAESSSTFKTDKCYDNR